MEERKLTTFSITSESTDDDIITALPSPEEIEKSQFTKIHFKVQSVDRVNAYGYTCSLRTLRKYGGSIAGKPILAWYNKFANSGNGDFGGHENSTYAKETPVGFFPDNIKPTFEKDDKGTVYLCADGYVWNVYCPEVVEVFENYEGTKGVSSEMLLIDTEIIEESDIEEILQFSFTGLTLLGDTDAMGFAIKPAVEGSCGTLITNSVVDEEYEKAKSEFENILYNSSTVESEESGSFLVEEVKEVNNAVMSDEKDKIVTNSTEDEIVEVKNSVTDEATITENAVEINAEILENAKEVETADNAKQVVTTREETSVSTDNYDDDGHWIGDNYESHRSVETKVVENSAEIDELKSKIAILEQSCIDKDNAYNDLMVKFSALEDYKKNKEAEETSALVKNAIDSVSDILSEEQIETWKNDGLKCSIETVNDFTNKIKAFAFDIQKNAKVINSGEQLRNGLPLTKDDNTSLDLWDRIEKKYK